MSGLLLLIGVVSGTSLVLLNVLLIGCCLHKRTKKRIMRRKFFVGRSKFATALDRTRDCGWELLSGGWSTPIHQCRCFELRSSLIYL